MPACFLMIAQNDIDFVKLTVIYYKLHVHFATVITYRPDPKIDVHICLLSYVEEKKRNYRYVEIIPHVRRNIKVHLPPRHEYNFE